MNAEKLSRLLYMLCWLPLLGFPLLWLNFMIDIMAFKTVAQQNLHYMIQWQSITAAQLYIAATLSFSPQIFLLWGIVNLRSAFREFMRSNIFNEQNIIYVNRFALSLILFALTSWIAMALVSVVLSFHHPAGQNVLSVQLGSEQVSILLVGLVFWLIGKVMMHGLVIQQDNQSIV